MLVTAAFKMDSCAPMPAHQSAAPAGYQVLNLGQIQILETAQKLP